MAINKKASSAPRRATRVRATRLAVCIAANLALAGVAHSREAASSAECRAAASQPSIATAKTAADHGPEDLRAQFALADAWSDAGCFNEAVQVLQDAKDQRQQRKETTNKELETRLRVARSLVGEEHFFDNLDRANLEAKLKRATFRCGSLGDLDACNEAVHIKPEDPALVVAQGDALLKAKRPADALGRYRHAASLAAPPAELTAKIATAEAQLPTGASATAGASVANNTPPASAQTGSAATAGSKAPIRVARATPTSTVAAPATRRYSNAAQNDRTH